VNGIGVLLATLSMVGCVSHNTRRTLAKAFFLYRQSVKEVDGVLGPVR